LTNLQAIKPKAPIKEVESLDQSAGRVAGSRRLLKRPSRAEESGGEEEAGGAERRSSMETMFQSRTVSSPIFSFVLMVWPTGDLGEARQAPQIISFIHTAWPTEDFEELAPAEG
jgi:hypothetical protein